MRTNWTISYTDFFGKKKVEAFTDKDEAQARYESLLPRTYGDFGDLMSVTAPIRSATKISESVLDDVDLSNQWDDLNAVVKGLFIRGFDNPSGKYFYVKSDYRNDEDACHSVYSKGTDSHQLDIHILGGEEPLVAVVNQGLQDEPFDTAYDAIELIVKDWFNMVTDGFHGVIAKIDDPSEYAVWKKSKDFKNEDGASASSLGVAPTGVVRRKTESVFDDDELERTGDQAPYRSMYAKDRKALQDALKVAQRYSPDAKIDPNKQKIVYNSPYGEVTIYTETFTGLGGSSDIQTHYEVSFIMYGHQHMTCDTLDDLDIVLKGISAGISKHPGDSWDDFVRNVKRATRKPRAKRSEALPPKQWGDRARKFPTRAALVKKAQVLQATEIGSYDEYLELNKDVCLDKIGFAMDINGNCVARLWWGEDDGKYYYSVKRDVLDRTV